MNGVRAAEPRKLALATALAAGCLLLLAQIAWACTAQPRIINLIPLSGRPGQEIIVVGQGVSPEVAAQDIGTPRQTGLVEVRWNSAEGPSLATAQVDPQGNFSAQVVVPHTPPGIYTVVVAAGQSGIARAAFEVIPAEKAQVTPGSRTARSADLWQGFSSESANEILPASPVSDDPNMGRSVGVAMVVAGATALLAGGLAAAGARKTSMASVRRSAKP